ncbi:RDD family protein [Lyngbya aestuarii]|uniref:RDD family protein n=1 Tax=Lyngbya aestuarii TaxID=118322 RepID=UPI00403E2122
MPIELVDKRFPKVPIERRAIAFLIDFVLVWLVSSLVPGNVIARSFVFLLVWLIWRVVIVAQNQGQSLGRWALDLKVIDAEFSKIPQLLTLTKREAITGFLALLATFGLTIGLANGISLLLLCAPLMVDWGAVMSDTEHRQAFHDKIAATLIVQTRRGFSLDLKVKKVLAQLQSRVRR